MSITPSDFLDMSLREISNYLEDNGYEEAWLDGTGSLGRMGLTVSLKKLVLEE